MPPHLFVGTCTVPETYHLPLKPPCGSTCRSLRACPRAAAIPHDGTSVLDGLRNNQAAPSFSLNDQEWLPTRPPRRICGDLTTVLRPLSSRFRTDSRSQRLIARGFIRAAAQPGRILPIPGRFTPDHPFCVSPLGPYAARNPCFPFEVRGYVHRGRTPRHPVRWGRDSCP